MAKVCCVEGCDALLKQDVTYFPFPIKQSLRRAWRDAITSPASKLTAESMVCSQHFTAGDYETVRGKVRLKAKVIPTVFQHNSHTTKELETNSNEHTNGKPDTPDSDNESNKSTKKVKNKRRRSPRKSGKENTSDQESSDSNRKRRKLDHKTGELNHENSNSSQESDKDNQESDKANKESDKANQESDKVNQESDKANQESDKGNQESDKVNEESDKVNEESDKANEESDKANQENGEDAEMNEGIIDDFFNGLDFGVETVLEEGSVDENGHEKCTIECAPEGLLPHDSESDNEPELHKEDIEDIIANYHIKQDKKLAGRLRAQQLEENQETSSQATSNQETSDKATSNQETSNKTTSNQESSKKATSNRKSSNLPPDKAGSDDCIEVEFIPDDPEEKEPTFIEICVDKDEAAESADGDGDCLMVLENVQVDIDPSCLLGMEPDNGDDDDSVEEVAIRKEDPISLLTSSDEDEVIIEEPHIDTVSVSDETDEDDVPLVRLLKQADIPKVFVPDRPDIGKLIWGNEYDFFCMICHHRSSTSNEHQKHRLQHQKVMSVCEICNFATGSQTQFARHKKKHKEEKRFKCHLCDYKAKHKMSLIYHLKSHEGVTAQSLKLVEDQFSLAERIKKGNYRLPFSAIEKSKDGYKCAKCKYKTTAKLDLLRHINSCKGKKMYSCKACSYETKKKSDLRRHVRRKHSDVDFDDDDEDDD